MTKFERRVYAAEAEANRRYAALPPETTQLERLAFIWGPNGAGLILGVQRPLPWFRRFIGWVH